MSALCNAFTKAAVDTWHRIQEGFVLDYHFGEETLTDLLLRDLRRHQLVGFSLKAFSKPKEGVNGADWEWWFRGSSGQWIGLRVQAKVIGLHGEFDHLHYPMPGSTKPVGIADHDFYQCDKLMHHAQSAPKSCIPVYCLYSYWAPPGYIPTSGAGCWGAWPTDSSFGCSILGAKHVRRLRRNGQALKRVHYPRHLRNTFPHSFPLAYLVCFPFEVSIAEHILTVLKRAGAVPKLGDDEQGYLHDSPPEYVTALLNKPVASAALFEGQQTDFLIDLPEGISRVVAVLQTRSKVRNS